MGRVGFVPWVLLRDGGGDAHSIIVDTFPDVADGSRLGRLIPRILAVLGYRSISLGKRFCVVPPDASGGVAVNAELILFPDLVVETARWGEGARALAVEVRGERDGLIYRFPDLAAFQDVPPYVAEAACFLAAGAMQERSPLDQVVAARGNGIAVELHSFGQRGGGLAVRRPGGL
jgi:hypothetical protein